MSRETEERVVVLEDEPAQVEQVELSKAEVAEPTQPVESPESTISEIAELPGTNRFLINWGDDVKPEINEILLKFLSDTLAEFADVQDVKLCQLTTDKEDVNIGMLEVDNFTQNGWMVKIVESYTKVLFAFCIFISNNLENSMKLLTQIRDSGKYKDEPKFAKVVAYIDDYATDNQTMTEIRNRMIKLIVENKDSMLDKVRSSKKINISVSEKPITLKFPDCEKEVRELRFSFISDSTAYCRMFIHECQFPVLMDSISDYIDTSEAYVKYDMEVLSRLYKESKKWSHLSEVELAKRIGEFCKKDDAQVIQRHGPIVFLMNKYGFNAEVFKKLLEVRFAKLSMPWKELHKQYFSDSLKTTRKAKKLPVINKYIDEYYTKLEKAKAEAERKQKELDELTKKINSTILDEPAEPQPSNN
jgi:hypothetical protein